MTHHPRILADLPNMVDLIGEKRLAYTLIEALENRWWLSEIKSPWRSRVAELCKSSGRIGFVKKLVTNDLPKMHMFSFYIIESRVRIQSRSLVSIAYPPALATPISLSRKNSKHTTLLPKDCWMMKRLTLTSRRRPHRTQYMLFAKQWNLSTTINRWELSKHTCSVVLFVNRKSKLSKCHGRHRGELQMETELTINDVAAQNIENIRHLNSLQLTFYLWEASLIGRPAERYSATADPPTPLLLYR